MGEKRGSGGAVENIGCERERGERTSPLSFIFSSS